MLTPTHLVFAQTAYLGACVVAAHPPAPEEAALALLGAMLPDLDTRASYIGRVFRLTFVYADPAQLDALAGRSLAQVDLVMQVRHAPRATLPTLDAPDSGTAVVPALLERWLP